MKKRVRSYLVFTSPLYRIVVYLLVPAAIVGVSLWTERDLGRFALLLSTMLLIITEVVLDSWLFGGMQARHFDKMDYLKTSNRGMGVLQSALCMDLLRKFLAVLGILAVCNAAMGFLSDAPGLSAMYGSGGVGGAGSEAEILLYYALVAYFFSALGTFLSRYGSLLWLNVAIGYLAAILALFCLILLPGLLQYIFLCNLLFAFFGAGVSFAAVWAAMKKMEGSYYDR